MKKEIKIKGKELKSFLYSFCFYMDRWEHMEFVNDPKKRGKLLGRELIDLRGPEAVWGNTVIKALYKGAKKLGLDKGVPTKEKYDPAKHSGYYWQLSDQEAVIKDPEAIRYLEDLFNEKIRAGYKADIETIEFIEQIKAIFE